MANWLDNVKPHVPAANGWLTSNASVIACARYRAEPLANHTSALPVDIMYGDSMDCASKPKKYLANRVKAH